MKLLNKLALTLENGNQPEVAEQSRRQWLRQVGLFSASGLILAACGTDKDDKKATTTPASNVAAGNQTGTKIDLVNDGAILNVALGLEHRAIAIYTAAAGLEFMKADALKPIVAVATSFLKHHQQHRDDLIVAINGLRAKNTAVAAAVVSQPAESYINPIAKDLTTPLAVLQVAAKEEAGAANAYIGAIASFTDPNFAKISGMLGGDEASHFGVLRAVMLLVTGVQDPSITTANVIPSAYVDAKFT
jgi:rubrerythrin